MQKHLAETRGQLYQVGETLGIAGVSHNRESKAATRMVPHVAQEESTRPLRAAF